MKFILLATYGSGTNLLRCFLNSHPDIYLHKELFCLAAGFNNHLNNPLPRLEQAFSYAKPIVGVDIKYDQLDEAIIEYASKEQVAIIHLKRDPLRTIWYRRQQVTSNYLNQYLRSIEQYRAHIADMFSSHRWLDISYEDMTRGQEIRQLPSDVTQRLLTFLGADDYPLSLHSHHSVKPLKVRSI
ncbi:MAG: hypothetical protein SFT92_02310 [Rickettsiales bacterium]|nr:hypothetical protein [Rickettsiales bacterium]